MEYVLISRPNNGLSMDMMPPILDRTKEMLKNPEKVVPGGKLLAAYGGLTQMIAIYIWDVPSIDSLMSFYKNTPNMGWDVEIIPVGKIADMIGEIEKFLAANK
jgi:hypothetical protein